jgi:hypothetical protein
LFVEIAMDEIKDYAYPTMMAERALRKLHEAFLRKDLEEARKMAVEAAFYSLVAWEALYDSEAKKVV